MSTETIERTDAEILDAAADRIERDGWEQGNEGMVACDGPKCLEGAVAAELGVKGRVQLYDELIYDYTELEQSTAYMALRTYLRVRPFRWNDTTGRTKEEVVAALRAAAAQARGESA